jgi:hypothetical protein
MKNSSDTFRNRTRDLPACGTVSQPTAPPPPEGSLPHSQIPTTCLYPDAAQSNRNTYIQLPEDPPSKLMFPFRCLGHTKISVQFLGSACEYFVKKIHLHGEELLTPSPNPKQEDHPLSSIHDCIFNIFAATLHIAGRSSIHNLRTRRAVLTGPTGHVDRTY